MHKYFLKTPWWVRKIYPSYLWKLPATQKSVYISFDDGPHPTITPWVLAELQKHNAKATFFCVGKNVQQYPDVYQQILETGHAVGNHTYSHLNGWQTADEEYLEDIRKATSQISSHLFRPPYGRIKKSQAKRVATALKKENAKVVMWDVLSADFDVTLSGEKCINTVLKYTEPGSIVVFHDSEKAFPRLKIALPVVLKRFTERGYTLERL